MTDAIEPTYGMRVVNRAWAAAWHFFESRVRDAVLFAVFFVAGGGTYYLLFGLPATMEQVVPVLVFTVGPIVVLWLLLFAWHLWLAPSALTYEAVQQALRRQLAPVPEVTPQTKVSPVNWAIWKQRDRYNLPELAAILAKIDPITARKDHPESVGFLRLLVEDAMSGKLRTVKDSRAEGYYKPDLWPTYFDVQKTEAIQWAEGKKFDLSHIA